MKVLDLQCRYGHTFEGWFASQSDYDGQRAQGLVTCPVCNNADITRMLSAPRLNLGHGSDPLAAPGQAPFSPAAASHGLRPDPTRPLKDRADLPVASAATELPVPDPAHALQAGLWQLARHVIANTEDVGAQFAEEARKIHYGEREERNIRGQATREETQALLDEGIAVLPLPLPDHLKGPLQ